jgi:predicted secreted protein
MDLFSAAVVFVVSFWVVLFAVLPIGVRSQAEAGTVVPGTEPGAPVVTNLRRKAIWALLGAAAITVIGFVVVSVLLP